MQLSYRGWVTMMMVVIIISNKSDNNDSNNYNNNDANDGIFDCLKAITVERLPLFLLILMHITESE